MDKYGNRPPKVLTMHINMRHCCQFWKRFSYLTLLSVFLDIMIRMGYSLDEIQDSLINQKYNDVMATYLLLDYRNSEVCYSIDQVNICLRIGCSSCFILYYSLLFSSFCFLFVLFYCSNFRCFSTA